MRAFAPLSFILVAACAHGGTPSFQPQDWEPLYGTYQFEGTLRGEGTSASVSGTLRLADGRYYLTTTRGTCDGRLAPTVSTDLGWGCRDGMGVSVRRVGNALATEGTAGFSEPKYVDREVCHTDSNGVQVCTTRTERSSSSYRGRITIKKVSDQE